ncbi:hypothetical protein OS493_027292 [Desmophyllum pertusum]|uniref:BRICHOS domain-containing protein n=1 Tax=Desmophyllum pertusum TaxID=174260 RepID=A0A9W9YXC8_9CNID|nr:hypothetical protein OS493_027292 [Desmophyllum pertusum]
MRIHIGQPSEGIKMVRLGRKRNKALCYKKKEELTVTSLQEKDGFQVVHFVPCCSGCHRFCLVYLQMWPRGKGITTVVYFLVSSSNSVEKYTLKMNKDGKDYEEKIEIDTEKETETFHVPKTSDNEEAGDIVYDFKQNLTMIRMPVTNSCFLMQSTGAVPKPADLKRLLENKNGVVMAKSQTEVKVKVVGTLEDRSHLIDEMVDLCAKLPIYVVTEGELDTTNAVQPTDNAPAKREWNT